MDDLFQIATGKTLSGKQESLTMQPILKSISSSPTCYMESSTDTVISGNCIDKGTSGRRRVPPPPPPRTSSRSPLGSPLHVKQKFQPRPLPNLPSTLENDPFTMPLVTKVASSSLMIHNSSSLTPQSPTHTLFSTDSKDRKMSIVAENPILTDTRITNNPQSFVPSQSDGKKNGPQDVILRPWFASSINSSVSRRTCQVDSNTFTFGDSSVPRNTLESRHQELLKTQKHLQEQYDRLQRFHEPKNMLVPSGNDVLQLVVPEPSQCSVQIENQTVDDVSVIPEHLFHGHINTETFDSKTVENQNLENQEMLKAAVNNVNHLKNHLNEKKEHLFIASTDGDCEKQKDYTFISTLLDNAHETDII